MKNTTLLLFFVIVIIMIGGFVFVKGKNENGNSVTGSVVGVDGSQAGDVQRVVLSEKNFNYYPSETKVKANQPVSISLDNKVVGCLRALTIRELGLSKYLKTPQETLDFTPTKTGTFTIACSMGMGYGKLLVE